MGFASVAVVRDASTARGAAEAPVRDASTACGATDAHLYIC